MAALTNEDGVNVFGVVRIEMLQHHLQPARFDVGPDMEDGGPGQNDTGKVELARGLAVADLDIAPCGHGDRAAVIQKRLDAVSAVTPPYPYFPYFRQEGFARLNPSPV